MGQFSQAQSSFISERNRLQDQDLLIHSLLRFPTSLAARGRLAQKREASTRKSAAVVITGKPGVGKTSLALHAAYKMVDAYQDGALYADLRGVDKEPVPSTEIVRRFLYGIGVPEEQIPADTDARLDRYRRELSNRRVVIILDNAGSESQVRPLIPPGSESLVLITSRFQLNGLEGIYPLLLDVFDQESSLTFLRNAVGEQTVAEDHPSACEIGELCGHLPLALRIVGNRLRYVSLTVLVEELRDQRNRLEALEVGDLAVRAAFNLSFRKLGKNGRNTLKRLSCIPGEDFGSALCAALNDSDERHALVTLRELFESNLIESSPRSGRFRFHDLIKAYAQEKFERDSDRKREVVLGRMLDWLSYSALKANLTLNGQIGRYKFPNVKVAEITSIKTAAAWIEGEALNAIPAIAMLAKENEMDRAKSLAVQLCLACEVVGNWQAWEDAVSQGLQVAESHPDPLVEVTLLISKANLLRSQREFRTALELAAKIYPKAVDSKNKMIVANAAKLLGCLKMDTGELSGALSFLEESLSLNKQLGLRHEVGTALYNIGTFHRASGRTHEAIHHFEQDLEICLESSDMSGAAMTMNTLALAHMEIGEFSKAEKHQREALKIFESFGNPHMVSMVCNDLAISLRNQDKFEEALNLHLEDIDRCKASGNRSGEVLAKANAAVLLVVLDRDNEAEPLFEEALSVLSSLEDESRLARTLMGQIRMHFKAGKIELGLEAANEAVRMLIKHGGVRDAVSVHQMLSQEFGEMGEYGRALFHAEESLRLGEGLVEPYLKAACYLYAIAASSELGRTDAAAGYARELRTISEEFPRLVDHLEERIRRGDPTVPLTAEA